MQPASPVFKVRCGAYRCDWSVTSNVEGELTGYFEAHVKASHPADWIVEGRMNVFRTQPDLFANTPTRPTHTVETGGVT